jgi:hypothetical protein
MILKSRSVMGRVRPRLLFQSNALAKNKSRDSSKLVLPAAKRLHVLDYWEELLGSPDDALRAKDQTTRPTECEVLAVSALGKTPGELCDNSRHSDAQ